MRQTLDARERAGSKTAVGIDRDHPLLLASASPRRRELLLRVGVPCLVARVHVDETPRAGEAPERYLERIVDEKLAMAPAGDHPAALVADTEVVHAGRILGKPADERDARAMIAALAGGAHQVMTRFAWRAASAETHAETVSTRVWFRSLDAAQIERYAATGEGLDKAGAYAIQGIGAMLVTRIEGSYTNVVGLPVAEVVASLQGAGLLGPCPIC
jgi:septum formation protein